MATYDDVTVKLEDINTNHRLREDKKFSLVGTPLEKMGDTWFKKLFSYVLGFEWLINLIYKLNLKSYKIHVPSINYVVKTGNENYMDRVIFASVGLQPIKLSSFVIGSRDYKINLLSFLPALINYFARLAGKLVGWAIASIFTVPAYIVIKIYYGIKDLRLNKQLDRILSKLPPQELAESWCGDRGSISFNTLLDVKKVAKQVKANDFFEGCIRQNSSHADNYDKSMEKYEVYSAACIKVQKTERNWSLAKTIFSGLFVIPLLFTIPSHLNLIKRQNGEKKNIEKNGAIIKEMNSFEGEKLDIAYRRSERLISLGREDLASGYIAKLPEDSDYYKKIMQQRHDAGIEYRVSAQEAVEESHSSITQKLLLSADANTITQQTFAPEQSRDSNRSSIQGSVRVAVYGSFASRSVLDNNDSKYADSTSNNYQAGSRFGAD